MAALVYDGNSVEASSHRNLLLRMLDAFAEWQMRQAMRQALRVISRGQQACGTDRAGAQTKQGDPRHRD